ncbi:MAG: preprotein translocase subunit SecA, partial [Acidobacteriota bacterium]
ELHEKGQPVLVGTISIEKSERMSALLKRRGIPHVVLNAKYHVKEAEIVAQAGRKGSVTIATNMAGRGTDILLGGNPEGLARTKVDPELHPEDYTRQVAQFRDICAREHEEVVSLGGLHILGTERHESRRIDNQLRGRSGRQGDPGSSRFYLSLEDDLMRLFGGDRLKGMMGRLGMEEGVPIEHPWVTKSIERAQTSVEARNFDIRKHLLEYDDVMNKQRTSVYGLRKRVLAKEGLRDYLFETAGMLLDWILDQYVSEESGGGGLGRGGPEDSGQTLFRPRPRRRRD